MQILGDGELASPLVIKAEVFSGSAIKKINKAGGKMVETPKKIKWTRKIGKERTVAKAAAATPVETRKTGKERTPAKGPVKKRRKSKRPS